MSLGWGPKTIWFLNDGAPRLSGRRSPAFLRPFARNHHGVGTGEELGLVSVLPLHPVMITGCSLQDLDYLTASPGGADLGRLDDDVISIFCVHRCHLHRQTYAWPPRLYRGF